MWLQHHGQKHSTGEQTEAFKKIIIIIRFIITTKTQHSPSFDFFFRARVPPNFPRKDSSFFILADCVVAEVPDIFQAWCVCVLSLSLFLSVSLQRLFNTVTPPRDAFRHRCTIQSQREDTKLTHSQANSGVQEEGAALVGQSDGPSDSHTGPCESTASSASMFTVGSPHSAPQRRDVFTDPHW